MLLNTIENIKLLLENAVDFQRREKESLQEEFKLKYGIDWESKLSKIDEERLYFQSRKVIEFEDILDDFVYHDWR